MKYLNHVKIGVNQMTLQQTLETHFDSYVEKQGYNGTVLVAKDGNLLFQKAYGMANHEHQISSKIDTKYVIASITKPMTAIAILMLMEEGLLDLHISCANYLPSDIKIDDRITIHHLLTHTSGVPDFESLPNFLDLMKHTYSNAGIMGLVEHLPLDFIPGQGYKYSNTGYNLLGMIIENVTQNSYEAYIKEKIFKPLDMNDTGCGNNYVITANLADGYSRNQNIDSKLIKAPYIETSNFKASGNLYSTGSDLLKWERGLHAGQLLTNESLSLMFTPHAYIDNIRSYGYGLSIYDYSRGHGGHLPGYWSKYRHYPIKRITIILLSNNDFIDEQAILDRTMQLF